MFFELPALKRKFSPPNIMARIDTQTIVNHQHLVI